MAKGLPSLWHLYHASMAGNTVDTTRLFLMLLSQAIESALPLKLHLQDICENMRIQLA